MGGAVVKNPPANAGDAKDTGSSPGLERPPGVGNSNHFSILAGKSQGQRTLAVYPPWVCKEWDTRLTNWTLKKSTFVIAWRLWLQSKRLYSHGHLFYLSHLTSQSLTPLWFSLAIYLNIVVYICQSQSPNSSYPLCPPWYPYVCSLHLCLCFCLADKFISTMFLDSSYMH